jgi:sterol desaturase/sphingolipid hydroxylase (fatty acid hydroxylase superfamily)
MLPAEEPFIRLAFFLGALILFAALEFFIPCKQRVQSRSKRWTTNLAIVAIDSFFIRMMGQVTALSTAVFASTAGWGLFNLVNLPVVFEIIIAVILLDLAVYAQHVATHKIPLLWKLHQVHHADRDIDVTTGARFHPVEISLSMLYKCLIVILLGPAALAVFIFEIVLNASAMFNHSNIKIFSRLDRWLRLFVVTPDMHRVHHSIIPKETDSNYGFCLSLWDKLFGTYIPHPSAGHTGMTIGLQEYQSPKPAELSWCLKLPFMRPQARDRKYS